MAALRDAAKKLYPCPGVHVLCACAAVWQAGACVSIRWGPVQLQGAAGNAQGHDSSSDRHQAQQRARFSDTGNALGAAAAAAEAMAAAASVDAP